MRFRQSLKHRLRGAQHLLTTRIRRNTAKQNPECPVEICPRANDSWQTRLAIREPYLILHHWLSMALDEEPTSQARRACLATVDMAGQPVTRMTNVEQINASGLTFYTSLGSRLAGEIQSNPHVSLQLHWPHLDRNVHISGVVSPVSPWQAQMQFARYPREVQLSMHGIPVKKRSLLNRIKRHLLMGFQSRKHPKVPLPPNWGGYLLSPTLYEFYRNCVEGSGVTQCMRFRRCLTLPRGTRNQTIHADRYDWVYDNSINHDV